MGILFFVKSAIAHIDLTHNIIWKINYDLVNFLNFLRICGTMIIFTLNDSAIRMVSKLSYKMKHIFQEHAHGVVIYKILVVVRFINVKIVI